MAELKRKKRKYASDAFDGMPYAIIVTDAKGTVWFKNRIAAKYMPIVKEGANIVRYSEISLASECVTMMEFYGKAALIWVIIRDILGEDCRVICVYPDFTSSIDRTNEYFRQNEAEVTEWMRTILNRTLDNNPGSECRKYITFLISSIGRFNSCRKLFRDYLNKMKSLEPRQERVCLLAPLFNHIKDYIEHYQTGAKLIIEVDCPPMASCRFNCYDLAYIQACMVSFTEIFTKSKKLKFTVTEERDDIIISASVRMHYKVYRMFFDSFFADGQDLVSGLFFPLAIINAIAKRNGCSVSYYDDGMLFYASLRIKQTLGLPDSLRANDDSMDELYECFDRYADDVLLPENGDH